MTTETQKTAIKHHPAMEALKALFVENKLVFQDITENMILFPSRLAKSDHGLPKEEYLNVIVKYNPEQDGFVIIHQVKIRKIDANDAKYSVENTKLLLEAVLALMEKEYPWVCEELQIPFMWITDYDVDAIVNDGYIVGCVQSMFAIKSEIEPLFDLLKDLESFPEVELHDATDASPEELEELRKMPNLLEEVKVKKA